MNGNERSVTGFLPLGFLLGFSWRFSRPELPKVARIILGRFRSTPVVGQVAPSLISTGEYDFITSKRQENVGVWARAATIPIARIRRHLDDSLDFSLPNTAYLKDSDFITLSPVTILGDYSPEHRMGTLEFLSERRSDDLAA